MDTAGRLLDLQSGVIARRQLHRAGHRDHDIRRLVRRRELVPIRRGVYLEHTGEPTWLQGAWASILAVSTFDAHGEPGDACLCGASALRLLNGPGSRMPSGQFHILVPHSRTSELADGIVIHRALDFEARWRPGHPPHVSYEDAALDVAVSVPDRVEALAVLARAVGDRHTTARRMLELSRQRTRIRGRMWLEGVLADIDAGTCSVLEPGFRNEVVRAHGLPVPHLQRREVTPIGVVYRDASYGGLNIELDGRMYHSAFERHGADLDRDLIAATLGQRTVRLGWGQVYRSPCRTAAALGLLITATPTRCHRSGCGLPATR